MKKLVSLILILLPVCTQAQTITTFAGDSCSGTGSGCFEGDGLPALSAGFDLVQSVRTDNRGNYYIADVGNYRVRKVDTGGIVTTFAGNGVDGYYGDGLPAFNAALNTPLDMAADKYGNVYIVDVYNSCIRKVDAGGIISTVIGVGLHMGYYGDGGKADTALINSPVGIAIDTTGNIFISDWGNNVIRKVDTAGYISTYAGNGSPGSGGDGGPATSASFFEPCYMAIDRHNNLYVADAGNNAIRKIDAVTGIITSFVTGLAAPPGITFDKFGNLYISEGTNTIRRVDTFGTMTLYAGNDTTSGFSGDGGPALLCELNAPQNMCTDSAGNLYIADMYNNRIRKIFYTDTVVLSAASPAHRQQGFTIYPNPTAAQLTIKSAEAINDISITNMMGETIITRHSHGSPFGYAQGDKLTMTIANSKQQTIDVSGLAPGVYFVKVDGVGVKRFVKE